MDWSFWDFLWTTFMVFVWISVLIIFFNVIFDVFRSRDLSGWGKAGWLILLVVLPLIGVLIYVLARGDGMAERSMRSQLDQAERIQQAYGAADATDQIARAKDLLDSGVIDGADFEQIKRRALAG